MTYKDKLKAMTDDELDKELQKVIDSRIQGYQMLGCRDLILQSSIKLHDEAIAAIKTEKSNRGI
jgi:hypothetical protein